MANGTYSRPGGYRNDRPDDERESSRLFSSDYNAGDTGQVRGFGDYESTREEGFGGRHTGGGSDRGSSRYEASRDRDDYGHDRSYGDNESSRAWARESYRANPSSFSYEPGRSRSVQPFGDRHGSGSDYGSEFRGSGYGASGNRGSSDERRGFVDRAGDEVRSWFGDEGAERRRAMDEHRGKGPKGYQRSDARIEEDVNDRLSDDPALDASNITVLVKESEVTLSGFVSSRYDKRRAEDIAEDISGVRHVQNNLRVNMSSSDNLTGSTTV